MYIDPFEALLSFHRRMERQLASLAALPAVIDAYGMNPEACATAAILLHCFDTECARRHSQQERELWPALEAALGRPEELNAFRTLRRSLSTQHREIEAAWGGLRRPLMAIAEGLPRRLDLAAIGGYRALFTTHIHGEEAALHRIAASARGALRH